jgi:hypothetical protein
MNVEEFSSGGYQTLAHYAEVTLSLTLFTIYTVVTLQTQSSFSIPAACSVANSYFPEDDV